MSDSRKDRRDRDKGNNSKKNNGNNSKKNNGWNKGKGKGIGRDDEDEFEGEHFDWKKYTQVPIKSILEDSAEDKD